MPKQQGFVSVSQTAIGGNVHGWNGGLQINGGVAG